MKSVWSSRYVASLALVGSTAIAALGQFTQVINVPPGGAPTTLASGTQLNVLDGGTLGVPGGSIAAMAGSEVNVYGGYAPATLSLRQGARMNMTGGEVNRVNSSGEVSLTGGVITGFSTLKQLSMQGGRLGDSSSVNSGVIAGGSIGNDFNSGARNGNEPAGSVVYTGGTFGRGFKTVAFSSAEFRGGEFSLNGSPVTSLPTGLLPNDVLTGTLEDGSVFVFAADSFDSLYANTVRLVATTIPPLASGPIAAPPSMIPRGLRAGETLVLGQTGLVGNDFATVGATLSLEGGVVGAQLDVVGGAVNVLAGSIGDALHAHRGAAISLTSGSLGRQAKLYSGSALTLSSGTIGDRLELHNSQLTIADGAVGAFLYAGSGSTVAVSGGSIGERFHADAGSTVLLSGGSIGERFQLGSLVNSTTPSSLIMTGGRIESTMTLYSGASVAISGGRAEGLSAGYDNQVIVTNGVLGVSASDTADVRITGGELLPFSSVSDFATLTVSGGVIGPGLSALHSTSRVVMRGGDFRLNGVSISAAPALLGPSDVLTGVLEDGAPFVLAPQTNDSLVAGTLRLESTSAPSATPIAYNVPLDAAPRFLRHGQSVTVMTEGVLPDSFIAIDAEMHLHGGETGKQSRFVGTNLVVDSGKVGDYSVALHGSAVTLNDGRLGVGFVAGDGSTVEIHDGVVGSGFSANPGSHVRIAGGQISPIFEADAGSAVELVGGDFRLNGVPVESPPVNLGNGVLTGTLSDGAVVHFSTARRDSFAAGTLHFTAVPLPDVVASVINLPTDPLPVGIRNGQTLNVLYGGVVPADYVAVDATVNVIDGVVSNSLYLLNTVMEVSGGAVGPSLGVGPGSRLTVSGGAIADEISLQNASATIKGGSIGAGMIVSDSTLDVTGGSIGTGVSARAGSVVILRGGLVGGIYGSTPDSQITVNGSTVGSLSTVGSVSLLSGQVNNLSAAGGGRVAIRGGRVGDRASVNGATLTIDGGEIGDFLRLDGGHAQLIVNDGAVGAGAYFGPNTSLVQTGGEIGEGLTLVADVRRGPPGETTLMMSGGQVGDGVSIDRLVEMTLIGDSFTLAGQPIEGLVAGVPRLISQRNVALEGVLLDGEAFRFDLNATELGGDSDYFHSEAVLSVVLGLPGDFSGDGVVDAADYTMWRDGLGDTYTQRDYDAWAGNFGAAIAADATTVPESATGLLVVLSVILSVIKSFRRP